MAAEHMDEVLARQVRGRWSHSRRRSSGQAAGCPEPWAGGGDTRGPMARPGPRGGRAGARTCLACGVYRCVHGGSRSPGGAGGKLGPGPDGGQAPGPGSRARGQVLELCWRAVYGASQTFTKL